MDQIWHELESKQTVINLITPPQPTIPRTPVNQRERRCSLRESIHTPHTMARRSLSPTKVMHSTLLPAFELRPERHKNPFATWKTMTKAPSPFKKHIFKSWTRSQVEHGSLLLQLDKDNGRKQSPFDIDCPKCETHNVTGYQVRDADNFIQCKKCKKWAHTFCMADFMGLTLTDLEASEWVCPTCCWDADFM